MNTESVNGKPGKGNFKPKNQLKGLAPWGTSSD